MRRKYPSCLHCQKMKLAASMRDGLIAMKSNQLELLHTYRFRGDDVQARYISGDALVSCEKDGLLDNEVWWWS